METLVVGRKYLLFLDDELSARNAHKYGNPLAEHKTPCVFQGKRYDEVLELEVSDFIFRPRAQGHGVVRLSLIAFKQQGDLIIYNPTRDPARWQIGVSGPEITDLLAVHNL